MVDKHRPLHIVMTPVRNEAWVLRAFLTATSLWADYIIIADQMSTDGSRDIYCEFPKVIVIDNTTPNFNEAERQSMLISKAREVAAGRDTLLWGLDADEILTANAFNSNDWQRIINSNPGAVFFFNWAILSHNLTHYYVPPTRFPWCFHDDKVEPHGNYVKNMHSMRIPYPIDEHDVNYITEFYIFHLSEVNTYRMESKRRFYIFIDWEMNNRSSITLARQYSVLPDTTRKFMPIDKSMLYTQYNFGIDLWNLLHTEDKQSWMDDYIYDRLQNYNLKDIAKLKIWDIDFLKEKGMHDPRDWWIKLFHTYLDVSMKYKHCILIRAIDKLLKMIEQLVRNNIHSDKKNKL